MHPLGFVAIHSLAISVHVEVSLSVEVIEQGSTNTFSETTEKREMKHRNLPHHLRHVYYA